MEKYHILERIGEGSFGKVYRGRRKFSGHIVALKFVTKQGKSARDLESLRQEITILRRLNHCNIIAMLDSFETEGEICMVTEYAQGELFQVLEDEHSLPEEEIRKIAIQLLQALHVLHSNRIIHRDMKPQNILIGSKQQIKLADFGFARAIAHDASVLTSIKGTPLYMAPELVQEKPYNYTADLWSLGVILYELAVGRPPFYTDRIVSLIQMIVREPVKYPSTMSADFQSFLAGLLNKDPSRRLTWPAILQHPFVLETPEQLEARLQLERQVRALPRFFDENQSQDSLPNGPKSEVKPSVERLQSCDEWKICDPETGRQLNAGEALAVSGGGQSNHSAAASTAKQERGAPGDPFAAGLASSTAADEFQDVWAQMQRQLDLEHVTAALLETPLFCRAVGLLPDLPLQVFSNEVGGAIHSLLHLQHRSQVSLLKHMGKLSSVEGLIQTRERMHAFLDALLGSYTTSSVGDDRVGDIMYQVVRCCMTSTSILNAIEVNSALATQLDCLELCKSDAKSILAVLSCKAEPVVAVQSKTLKWLGCMIDRSRDLTEMLEVVLPSGLVETLCQILHLSENLRSPGGRISQRGRDRGIYSMFALAAFVQPDGSSWGPLHPFPVLTLMREDLLPIPSSSLRVVKHLYKLRVKVHAEVGSQLLRKGLGELVAILRDEISERVMQKKETRDDTDVEEDGGDEDADQSTTCCILKLLLHACRASAPLSKKLAATTVVLDRRRNGDIFGILLRGFESGALYPIERYFATEFLSVILRRGVLSMRQVWRIARTLFPLVQDSHDIALLSALSTFFADVIESGNVDESALSEEERRIGLSPADEELWQLVAHGVLSSRCASAVFRLFSGEHRESNATNASELPSDERVQMLTSYNIRAQGLMDAGVVLFLRVAAKATKQSPERDFEEDGDDGDVRRSRATRAFLAVFKQESVWQTLDDMMAASGGDLLSPWGLFCFLKLMRMIREMQCSEPRVETAINNHILAHLVQLLELRHIEHLFHWPEVVGGGSNAVRALVHATVKVLGIPFMRNTPDELLVDTQEILYDAQCVEKLLGVLRFVFSTNEVHLGASVLELPISFLSRLVTSSAHFGAQFVAADGMGIIKECGMLYSTCSPSLIIDTLLIVSQLARSSEENYDCILQASLLPEVCELLAHPEAMVRAKTLNCIGNLCRHSTLFYRHFLSPVRNSATPAVSTATILDGVVRGLADPDSYVRRFACFAVGNAAFHNSELYAALSPAIPLLVRNLHSPEEKTRSNAGGALGNLVRNSNALCGELCAHQAPWELFELSMTDASTASRRIVLFSLGNLCVYPQCFRSLLEAESGFVGQLERLYEDVVADESSRRNIRRILTKVEALTFDDSLGASS